MTSCFSGWRCFAFSLVVSVFGSGAEEAACIAFSRTHEAMSGYALAIAKMGYAAYCFDFCGGSDKSKSDGKTDEMTG